MTIEVPNSAVNGQSNFIYNVTTPYKAGTQLYVVLGDSFGGASGGGSQLYTVLDSDDTSCLFPTYTVPNLGNLALPTASQTATFNNEKGAVATGVPSSTSGAPTSTSSNGSSNRGGGGGGGASVGAITGGVIGGAIAVAVIVAAAIFFLVIRRRRQKQREAARKEDAHFVDLDGDEDDAAGAFGARRNRRGSAHLGQGVQQTYEVSPFQYHPMHQESPEPVQSPYLDNPASRPGSIAASQRESGYGLSQYPPDPARQGAAAPSMLHSSYVQAPDATANNGDNILALGHSTSSSTGDSAGNGAQAYRLQTRNEAPALPRKAPLPGDEEAQGSSTPRRLVVHSDGGPLPQPVSDDEEDYTELPPQYGGWARQQQAETETTPQTQTQPQPPREQ